MFITFLCGESIKGRKEKRVTRRTGEALGGDPDQNEEIKRERKRNYRNTEISDVWFSIDQL